MQVTIKTPATKVQFYIFDELKNMVKCEAFLPGHFKSERSVMKALKELGVKAIVSMEYAETEMALDITTI